MFQIMSCMRDDRIVAAGMEEQYDAKVFRRAVPFLTNALYAQNIWEDIDGMRVKISLRRHEKQRASFY